MTNKSLLVQKQNIFKTQIEELTIPELQEGEILFKIESYALTSNNVTYAVSGFTLKYWNFFPVDETWGRVPVWGFATVVASKCEGVEEGEECYGYFPMSEYLVVQPVKVRPHSFSDGVAHRQGLAAIYNSYERVKAYPMAPGPLKDYLPIIRPLFATSFLIYYFLRDEKFFDSEQIVLTSASSKTGLALAYMLKQNHEKDAKKIVGLTSARNVEFVEGTGYYDEVLAYEDLEKLNQVATCVVDFAGNTALLHSINDTLGDNLKYFSLVGLTDWKGYKGFKELPKSKFFFAPNHIARRYKEWGAEKTAQLLTSVMWGFIQDIEKGMTLEYVNNFEGLEKLFVEMVKGEVNPSIGYIIKAG